MLSNLSLRAKLYLQYGIVLIPIFLVLAYFLHENHKRFTGIVEEFTRYNAMVETERHYKHFIDAVLDAVDSEKLNPSGLQALKQAQDSLVQSGLATEDQKQLVGKFDGMLASLRNDASLANLADRKSVV